MPTYVYECSSCNEVFEVEQRITEDPLTDCRCGSAGTVVRVIQPVGIAFKGGGFYVNDASPASKPAESAPQNCGTAESPCACAREAQTLG